MHHVTSMWRLCSASRDAVSPLLRNTCRTGEGGESAACVPGMHVNLCLCWLPAMNCGGGIAVAESLVHRRHHSATIPLVLKPQKEKHAEQSLCMLQDKNIKHNGNLKLNDIIEIARVMAPRSCAKTLAGTCKEILGTCQSVGCSVEDEHPLALMKKIDIGDIEVPEK